MAARFSRGSVFKIIILILFIAAAVITVRSPAIKELLTAEKLGAWLAAAGLWAPLVFILFYAVGVCLFIPGTLLTALGAAIFGAYWGFLYVWVGAMLGAAGEQLGASPRLVSRLRQSLNGLSTYDFGKMACLDAGKRWRSA